MMVSVDETAMYEELAPHQAWYNDALTIEEQRWADEINATIFRVSRELPGRGVSQGWINKLASEEHPITQRHYANVAELQAQYLRRSQPIWDKYLGARI